MINTQNNRNFHGEVLHRGIAMCVAIQGTLLLSSCGVICQKITQNVLSHERKGNLNLFKCLKHVTISCYGIMKPS